MPIRVRINALGSIASTKLLTITSAETLYVISSGYVAFEATNRGSNSIFYGDSGVLLNSGGILVSNGSKFWDSITDNFQMYFSALGTATSQLVIHEYA